MRTLTELFLEHSCHRHCTKAGSLLNASAMTSTVSPAASRALATAAADWLSSFFKRQCHHACGKNQPPF